METLSLQGESTSVARARAFVGRLAAEHLRDTFPAELITSELVANAVQYAPRDLTVRVAPGPPFRVEVHDGAAASPELRRRLADRPPPTPPGAASGRGLELVHRLAASVGVENDAGTGKVVWVEL